MLVSLIQGAKLYVAEGYEEEWQEDQATDMK